MRGQNKLTKATLTMNVCHRSVRGDWIEHQVTTILKKVGHQVGQVRDGAANFPADTIVWIQGNANWYPNICRRLIATPPAERPQVILWHTESLPPPKVAGLPWPRLSLREVVKILLRDMRATDVYTNYFVLRRLAKRGLPDVLVVSTLGRREFLAERGIAAHWVPLGYDPSYGHDLELPRDIDVLFLGALDVPRRNRLLRHLRREGIGLLAVGSWFEPAYWGENRTHLLNRTKILLNFARTPGELSGFRLILGMANKALVISEPIYNPAPYVSGKHFISASVEEMPEAIRYYLSHPYERERIVREAHRFVTEELTMEQSILRILDLVAEPGNRHLKERGGHDDPHPRPPSLSRPGRNRGGEKRF